MVWPIGDVKMMSHGRDLNFLVSVNDRLSACINYRHPRLRQILREITDPFTVLEQKLALSLEGK